MAVAEYLTQLQADKQTLVDNLVAKGVEATSDETFTSLVPKVADISSGASFEITDASYLFYGGARTDYIDELCSAITPECANFIYMFQMAQELTEVPYFDTSNGTDFTRMFCACNNLTKMHLFNTSKGTNFTRTFYECRGLKEIPLLDTSNGTIFKEMFQGCSGLTEMPLLDTSNGTDFYAMFYRCSGLTEIPLLDTSNGTNFDQTFYWCSNLIKLPQIDTSKATTFNAMCSRCSKLVEIPLLNAEKVIYINNMLGSCSSLTTLGGFKNLGKAYTQTTNNLYNYRLTLSDSPLLTHDSLMNVINNLYDLNLSYDVANGGTLYAQSLIIATECQSLLTEEEIAIATNKGWNVSFA